MSAIVYSYPILCHCVFNWCFNIGFTTMKVSYVHPFSMAMFDCQRPKTLVPGPSVLSNKPRSIT